MLRLREGDVVRLGASGAGQPDGGVVEVLGPFLPGAAGPSGTILEAAGTPSSILIVAQRPGTVTLEIARVIGPGSAAPGSTPLASMDVVVEHE